MFERWIDICGKITPTRQSVLPERSVLLLGPRRSGKTTLLKKRFPTYTYTTLDDLDYLDWARRDPKGFVQSLGKHALIDEIQRHPPVTIAIKYSIDEEQAHFIMTGSSAIGLLDATADSLAGRIVYRSLPTACWGENVGPPVHRVFHDRASPLLLKEAHRRLRLALKYGQFPEVLNHKNEETRGAILRNYRNSYFTRDLMRISNIENLDGIMALYHHLSRSIGSMLETSNFAREAGISFVTAKKYLNSLFQSGLAFKVTGYQYGPAKRYVKAGKTYFSDIGIVESFGVDLSVGQRLENFVIAELEKRRRLGFLKSDGLHYYRSIGGREIDVILETEDEVLAIEIKATTKPSKKDIRALKEFVSKTKKPVRRFMFYTGLNYEMIDNVLFVPVAALYRSR